MSIANRSHKGIFYHVVRRSRDEPDANLHVQVNSQASLKDRYFLTLLDVHGVGRAAGVPESTFKAIFYACGQCGHYMTERISENHYEDSDLGDNTCINQAAPWPESLSGREIRRITDRKGANQEKFPILEPL